MAVVFKCETKVDRAKEWLNEKVNQGAKVIQEHEELMVVCVPVFYSVGKAVVKELSKLLNMKKQKDIKELYCYDNHLGHYWSLRRELSNKEWLEIDRRKKNGERLADILAEMRVLK